MNYQVNSALQSSHVTQQKDVAKTDWRLVHFLYNSIIQTCHFQTKRTPECVLHYVNNKYNIKTFKIILSMQCKNTSIMKFCSINIVGFII